MSHGIGLRIQDEEGNRTWIIAFHPQGDNPYGSHAHATIETPTNLPYGSRVTITDEHGNKQEVLCTRSGKTAHAELTNEQSSKGWHTATLLAIPDPDDVDLEDELT